MKPRTLKILLATATLLLGSVAAAAAVGTTPTDKPVAPATLGVARPFDRLAAVIDEPGPITLETVVAADWEVDRGGLLNLDDPQAKAAGLTDGQEPIQVYFHAVTHPQRGLYVVDTGLERALRDDPDHAAIRGLVASFMNREKLVLREPLGDWLERRGQKLEGVFLTHLHLDHIGGMPDVPAGTPIYLGPGETTWRGWENFFVGGTTERLLAGRDAIFEWPYAHEDGAPVDSVVDVFGDGSFWALSVPGHTPGSSAYLARTPEGPVLLVGDACHTAWGWQHGVEPGSFSHDRARSRESLAQLRALAAEHPKMQVRLGHQAL